MFDRVQNTLLELSSDSHNFYIILTLAQNSHMLKYSEVVRSKQGPFWSPNLNVSITEREFLQKSFITQNYDEIINLE